MPIRSLPAVILFVLCAWPSIASAQDAPPPVDFDAQIKPLIRARCLGCHGPNQQFGGLRFDRRRSALNGGAHGTPFVPGRSSRSLIVARISGNTPLGSRMPPNGRPLAPEEVTLVRRWIDEGATWPEASDEAPATTPDPRMTAIAEAYRLGDRRTLATALGQSNALTLRGPGGNTALMYAALYGTANDVQLLLDRGADPNVTNDEGATPLMRAASDAAKARLLIDRGADVAAHSADGRTALHVAAQAGAAEVVSLIVARGVQEDERPSATPALALGALSTDDGTISVMLARGERPSALAHTTALVNAATVGCLTCLGALAQNAVPEMLAPALGVAAALGRTDMVRALVDRGAPLDGELLGYTPLMWAASADRAAAENVALLLEQGAKPDVAHARTGLTALAIARRKGDRAVIAALEKATDRRGDIRAAIGRSLGLLQESEATFIRTSGCVSCHHDVLPALLARDARARRIPVDAEATELRVRAMHTFVDGREDRLLQGIDLPGGGVGPLLVAMHADQQPATAVTDAMVKYLALTQLPDGRWPLGTPQPPLAASDIGVTAMALRGLQLYAPPALKAEMDRRVKNATAWLVAAPARSTEEQAMRLLGLTWGGAPAATIAQAARALAADQRADGGWAQLPGLDSDAYATGQALVALGTPAAPGTDAAAHQRGITYLLRTQRDDGSWEVKTRALPIMVSFDTGFPHGASQYISAAATSWAAMALIGALR